MHFVFNEFDMQGWWSARAFWGYHPRKNVHISPQKLSKIFGIWFKIKIVKNMLKTDQLAITANSSEVFIIRLRLRLLRLGGVTGRSREVTGLVTAKWEELN